MHFVINRQQNVRHHNITDDIAESNLQILETIRPHRPWHTHESNPRKRGTYHPESYQFPVSRAVSYEKTIIVTPPAGKPRYQHQKPKIPNNNRQK